MVASATPHADRIEAEELARLVEEFRATAERQHRSADAAVIVGRPSLSVRHRTRAWAYTQAARRCHEQLLRAS
jgi:hypothetical protein